MNNNIEKLRLKRKMTKVTLSRKLDISVVTLTAYENGRTSPKIETIKKLMGIFDCEFWDLFCKK